jgi:hypothetical protein
MAYRERERLVLFAGLAAASVLTLTTIAAIAGTHPGKTVGRFAFSLVLLYLCARLWGHATTLAERGVRERLAVVGRIGAPIIFLLLLLQTWRTTMGMRITLISLPTPEVHIATITRLEWSADIAVFGLFLTTAIAVWLDESAGVSRLLSLGAYTVIGCLTLDLLAAAWGVVSLTPQARLVAALFVLSLAGTIVVAIVRRVERLDEVTESS